MLEQSSIESWSTVFSTAWLAIFSTSLLAMLIGEERQVYGWLWEALDRAMACRPLKRFKLAQICNGPLDRCKGWGRGGRVELSETHSTVELEEAGARCFCQLLCHLARIWNQIPLQCFLSATNFVSGHAKTRSTLSGCSTLWIRHLSDAVCMKHTLHQDT